MQLSPTQEDSKGKAMPSKPSPDRFLNYSEVAAMIGLHWTTIRDGKAGTSDLPRIKLGSRVVFSFNAVQEWMISKAEKAEKARARSRTSVVDLLTEKSRRRQAIENTLKTITNGGRYSR